MIIHVQSVLLLRYFPRHDGTGREARLERPEGQVFGDIHPACGCIEANVVTHTEELRYKNSWITEVGSEMPFSQPLDAILIMRS